MIGTLLYGLLVVVLVVGGLGFLASLLFLGLLHLGSRMAGQWLVSGTFLRRVFVFWGLSAATFLLGAIGMAVMAAVESEGTVPERPSNHKETSRP